MQKVAEPLQRDGSILQNEAGLGCINIALSARLHLRRKLSPARQFAAIRRELLAGLQNAKREICSGWVVDADRDVNALETRVYVL